jgi:hypothetical protein
MHLITSHLLTYFVPSSLIFNFGALFLSLDCSVESRPQRYRVYRCAGVCVPNCLYNEHVAGLLLLVSCNDYWSVLLRSDLHDVDELLTVLRVMFMTSIDRSIVSTTPRGSRTSIVSFLFTSYFGHGH